MTPWHVQRLAGSCGQRGDPPVTAEPVPEPVSEAVPEPVSEAVPEPVPEPVSEPAPNDAGSLYVPDPSAIPDEPPEEILYHHRAPMIESAKTLWANRDIVFTLAERDFRVQYKQASLGIIWALLTPVATLLVLIIVFARVKSFHVPHVHFAIYAFVGVLCWSFFATSLGLGGTSLLSNKALLGKTQFPRECFPIENMIVNGVNTVLSWFPLAILFVWFGEAPKLATVWVPLFMLIEVLFATGLTLATASLIIQFRDLNQLVPIIISLGIFLTPVIWPFSKIPSKFHVTHGHLVNGHLVGGITVNPQVIYGFINPLGPVINSIRETMLLGQHPTWPPLIAAAISSVLYFVFGYKIFKRFEVHFADIA
jgi:lipopolysaccharide transport system permease protein